jgi:glycoside/pentoside/hexuronide:cation symporter, GPH family
MKPIGRTEIVGYGVADAGQALIGTLIGYFQLYYFTDVMLLPARAVAGLYLVTKILDSLSFPLFGLMLDRFNGRYGTFRTWLGALIIPFFVVSTLMFFFVKSWSTSERLVYIYIVVGLYAVVSALLTLVYTGLVSSIGRQASDRARLTTARFICAFGASTATTLLVFPMVKLLGGQQNGGFQVAGLIFAVVSALLLYITYRVTTERVAPGTSIGPGNWHQIGLLFRERMFLAAAVATFGLGLFVAIKSQVTLFFIQYVMARPDITSFMLAGGTVASATGVLLVGLLINKIDRRNLFVGLMLLNSFFIGVIYFLNKSDVALICAAHFLNSLFGGACAPVMFSIYSDIVDYFEETAKLRSPALINSVVILAGRLGGSLGSFLAPLGLFYFRYQPNAVQSPMALNGITIMFTLGPAAFALAAAAVMKSYKLTNGQSEAISLKLAGVDNGALGGTI